jgi:hypothetical protein
MLTWVTVCVINILSFRSIWKGEDKIEVFVEEMVFEMDL